MNIPNYVPHMALDGKTSAEKTVFRSRAITNGLP